MSVLSQDGKKRQKALRLWISHETERFAKRLLQDIMTHTAEDFLEEAMGSFPRTFSASAAKASQTIMDEREKRRPIIVNGQARPEEEG